MQNLKTCPHCAEKDLQPEAKICKHCGKSLDLNPVRYENRIVFGILFLMIFIAIGFVHIITGSKLPYPHLCAKNSFGYAETFINLDEITGMPMFAAKSKFPLSIKVLQDNGYLESDEAFQQRIRMQIEKDMEAATKKAEQDMIELQKRLKQ